MTTDVPGTALCAATAWQFHRWLSMRPTASQAALTGMLLGLTLLTKATYIILYPTGLALWLFWRYLSHARTVLRLDIAHLTLLCATSLLTLNAGYGFAGTCRLLKSYTFTTSLLADHSSPTAPSATNRAAESLLGFLPVPLPCEYVQGIDCQRSYFERRLSSYMNGAWRLGGWWYYYVYALLIKVPSGFLLLFLFAIVSTLVRARGCALSAHDMLVLGPAIAVLVFVSSQTGFSKSVRYVLAVLPFLFIWTSRLAALVSLRPTVMSAPIVAALAWAAVSSLCVVPHSLSYFNELAGGPSRGYLALINANIDWGQDLRVLKQWVDDHPDAQPMRIAYWGPLPQTLVGLSEITPPVTPAAAKFLRETAPMSVAPEEGWYAISVTLMQGYRWRASDPPTAAEIAVAERFSYFRQLTPVARAGYSILIFHITSADVARMRPLLAD